MTCPRVFNRTVFFDTIKDGKLTALDDKAYDMTGPIDGNPMQRRGAAHNVQESHPRFALRWALGGWVRCTRWRRRA